MCRNIKTLFNFEPPATSEEIREASLQFVRKLSGSTKPSKSNEEAFYKATDDIAKSIEQLLNTMTTSSVPKNREYELVQAKKRSAIRFSKLK